jgi:peptidoglycan DL-endopeptidase CwlO
MRPRPLLLLLAILALPLGLWAALPVVSSADQSLGEIQSKISHKQSLVGGHKAHERVLTTDISAFTTKIDGLEGQITTLQSRQQKLQTSLDADRDKLQTVQTKLRSTQARLTRLRARLLQARHVLGQRLVALYKADRPDLVSVVLNANGFADLLEQTEFIKRISRQDVEIVDDVKSAKADATTTATSLSKLEKQVATVTAQVQHQRDQVADLKSGLVDKRDSLRTQRQKKSALLKSSQDRRHQLEDDIGSLTKAANKIQAKLAGLSCDGLPKAGKPGSGLIWPVNGPITSPFCESRSWESCHPGIDIGVPEGTPIHAAAAGKVVLMQTTAVSGGYGNYTCIQHTASFSTCYAHQSQFQTTMGAHVAQGQVIGISGCTGRCFGPHVHFETRVNGTVVNPMNYL